jgi:hypothetical protein
MTFDGVIDGTTWIRQWRIAMEHQCVCTHDAISFLRIGYEPVYQDILRIWRSDLQVQTNCNEVVDGSKWMVLLPGG